MGTFGDKRLTLILVVLILVSVGLDDEELHSFLLYVLDQIHLHTLLWDRFAPR